MVAGAIGYIYQDMTTPPKPAPPPAKLTATATIVPMGPRATAPRDHLIEVIVDSSDKKADTSSVAGVARLSLDAFPPSPGWPDRRRFDGAQASVVCFGRPADASVEELRRALAEAGCRVILRETRECAEPSCATETMMEWNRPSLVPRGWFTSGICGRHDYRACPGCKSVYTFTSTNCGDHAPSVHCQVCGSVMIEWGSSKVWEAQLVTRGAP